MVAAGTAPDIAYIPDAMISKWASAGWLMDLSDHFQNDSEASTRMRQIYYKLQDHIIGTSAAIETIILYYRFLIRLVWLIHRPQRKELGPGKNLQLFVKS